MTLVTDEPDATCSLQFTCQHVAIDASQTDKEDKELQFKYSSLNPCGPGPFHLPAKGSWVRGGLQRGGLHAPQQCSLVVALHFYCSFHGNQGWGGETERKQTQGKVTVKLT